MLIARDGAGTGEQGTGQLMVRPVLPSVYSPDARSTSPRLLVETVLQGAAMPRATVDFFPDQNLNKYSVLFPYDLIVTCLHAPQPTLDQKNHMLITGAVRMLAKRRTASTVLTSEVHPSRWRPRSTRRDCESPTACGLEGVMLRREMTPCARGGEWRRAVPRV